MTDGERDTRYPPGRTQAKDEPGSGRNVSTARAWLCCLSLLITTWSGNAIADWTLMGGVTDIYAAYADTASVRRIEDGHVEMWGLYNFSRPDVAITGQPHRSTRSLREYDCETPRVRLLTFVDHTGPMGTGEVIPAFISAEDPAKPRPPRRWEAVVPGAVDEAFWKAACGK